MRIWEREKITNLSRDGHWTCSVFRTLNKSWTKWTNEQWTPHFWPSEHMNMNTFFLSVFRTHEHEHANFYVVQLLFMCSTFVQVVPNKSWTLNTVQNIVLKLFICSKSFPFWFGILLFGISLFGIPCEWLILFSHTLRIEKDRIQLEREKYKKWKNRKYKRLRMTNIEECWWVWSKTMIILLLLLILWWITRCNYKTFWSSNTSTPLDWEKVDYLWIWSSSVGIEIRLIVTREYRTTDL